MHQVIGKIIDSTEKRVKDIENTSTYSDIHNTHKRDIGYAIYKAKKDSIVPVIAEIKPASPSTFYKDIPPQKAVSIAKEMEKAGAVAISVLTEPEYFHGSIDNLKFVRNEIELPVLRKDFIIDGIQMDEAHSDLILLIASILGDRLDEFVSLAQSKGLEPLVEVHNKNELENALRTRTNIIGVNNRNLDTLEINLQITSELAPLIKQYDSENGTNHIIVSESGIHTTDDVKRLIQYGADALLIGTSIIKSDDIYSKTKELVEALK
ncbi:MAG: indole-3-glycerol-phosphate synthase [Methanohalobium sp.]|uniref:indole-3-glycerol-phosphate synthase n=1 Tax=Methanohalobium sp. TaxID=2837493 RepID=UPI00397A3BA2